MRLLGGMIVFFGIFLVPTILLNAPLLGVVLIVRRRLNPSVICWLLACGFVAAGAWWIWKAEWFDVWRHGAPFISYMLTAYVPSLLLLGCAGWMIGRRIGRRSNLQHHSAPVLSR